MGVNMNFLMNLIQLGLDVGILALCCEAVFRQKSEIKGLDACQRGIYSAHGQPVLPLLLQLR